MERIVPIIKISDAADTINTADAIDAAYAIDATDTQYNIRKDLAASIIYASFMPEAMLYLENEERPHVDVWIKLRNCLSTESALQNARIKSGKNIYIYISRLIGYMTKPNNSSLAISEQSLVIISYTMLLHKFHGIRRHIYERE